MNNEAPIFEKPPFLPKPSPPVLDPNLPANNPGGSHHHRRSSHHWASLITKVYFPRLVIPITNVASGIVDFGLAFLIVLVGLVYLLARGLQLLPPYTSKAQYYVDRGVSEVKRFSDMAAEPVLFIEGIIARLKAIFGQISN